MRSRFMPARRGAQPRQDQGGRAPSLRPSSTPRSCWSLSAPGTQVPDNQVNAARTRAAQGSDACRRARHQDDRHRASEVGVDLVKHTISLVNPSGDVVAHLRCATDPARQAALKRIKVCDSLTAIGIGGLRCRPPRTGRTIGWATTADTTTRSRPRSAASSIHNPATTVGTAPCARRTAAPQLCPPVLR